MATLRDQDFVGCGSDFFEPLEPLEPQGLLGLTKITYIGIVNAYVRFESSDAALESEASKSLQGFSCNQIGGEI